MRLKLFFNLSLLLLCFFTNLAMGQPSRESLVEPLKAEIVAYDWRESSLQSLKDEIEAKGWPTTFEALKADYEKSLSGQNGADLILEGIVQSMAKYGSPPLAEDFLFTLNRDNIPLATAFFEETQAAMDLIRLGILAEQVRYPLELKPYPETYQMPMSVVHVDIATITSLKRGLILLKSSSELHHMNGDLTQAVSELINLYKLADTVSDFPELAHFLIRESGYRLGQSRLETILKSNELSANELLRLQDYFGSLEESVLVEKVIGYEIVNRADIEIFSATLAANLIRSRRSITDESLGELREYVSSGALNRELTAALRHWIDLVDASELPVHVFLKRGKELEDQLREMTADENFLLTDASILNTVPETFAKTIASSRLVRTAVAIELFRQTHDNEVPDRLALLVPDYLPQVLSDPFDGEPLRYQKNTPNSYKIYSVGQDLIDNNGIKPGSDESRAIARTSADGESQFDLVMNISR